MTSSPDFCIHTQIIYHLLSKQCYSISMLHNVIVSNSFCLFPQNIPSGVICLLVGHGPLPMSCPRARFNIDIGANNVLI